MHFLMFSFLISTILEVMPDAMLFGLWGVKVSVFANKYLIF